MRTMTQSLAHACAAFMLVLTIAVPAFAQDHPPKDNGVRVEELQRLVNTLESDGDRKRLVEQLKGLVSAQRKADVTADDGVLGTISERLEVFGEEVMDAVGALKDVPKLMDWVGTQLADPAARARWGDTLWKLAALMAAGIVADHVLGWLLRRPERAMEPAQAIPSLMRVPLGLARALMRLVPVAGFAASAYGVLSLFALAGNTRIAALMVVTAYASVRGLMVLARFAFAPRTPMLRLAPVGDETAEYLVIWVRRLAGVGVFGYFATEAARLLGLPKGGHVFVMKSLGLAITTMLVIFILQNRAAVASWLRGPGSSSFGRRVQGLQNRLADVWHVLAGIYVVAGYGVWAVRLKGGFDFMLRASLLTILILVVAAMVSTALRRLIERGFAVSQDAKAAFPLLEGRANRYLPVLHVVLRGAVALGTVLALAQAWGLDTLGVLSSDMGRRVMASGISISAVLLGALVVWELVSGTIERYLAATDHDGNAVARSARARTLLPLIRNALFIVLVVMVSLIVLAELGVNIAPLLAGAGVVGVAIGFGSQTLVKDVITGAFILFEDTISVGDSVKVNGNAGTVEAMSIRAIRLRDGTGSMHTIPFSSVTSVVNMSREYAFANIEVAVDYGEDADGVMAVLKDLGAELKADPVVGPLIVDPLEIFGLERFEAQAFVIAGRFKTLPQKQGCVLREFNRRMKMRFDELGIERPSGHTTLVLGEDGQGKSVLGERLLAG
ncbi:MAG: mechanosensitive ion channel [Rhodospirillaceae bacterium]|nr:mechanosensitive ion channel [Rhodospirillales bacterium]